MRIYKALLFCILVIGVIYSCSESNDNVDFTLDSFCDTVNIGVGNAYKSDSLFLVNPRWIRYHPDSFLIIQELRSPKMITVLDLKSNGIQKLISKGKGPGEMLSAWGIEIQGNILFVFCSQLRKVIKLSPDAERKFQILDEYLLDEKQTSKFYPLTGELSVCLSDIGDESRLVYLTKEGKLIKKFGDYPPLLNRNEVKPDNDIFASYISAIPNGSKFAVVCAYTDIIEIYDIENGLEKRIHGPLGINLEAHYVKVGPGRMTRRVPAYLTYCMVDAGLNEFMTGLVSYKGEKNKGPQLIEAYPKKILCFDWNGKPLRIFNLEFPIFTFDMDWKNKILYTVKCADESPEIVSFSLKDIL